MSNTNDPVLSMLSLACKAGKIKSGEFAVEKAVKEGQAKLVIVAVDASVSTKDSYKSLCKHFDIPVLEYGDKTVLGRSIGKEFRAAAAVCDTGFSKSIAGRIKSIPRG